MEDGVTLSKMENAQKSVFKNTLENVIILVQKMEAILVKVHQPNMKVVSLMTVQVKDALNWIQAMYFTILNKNLWTT